MAAGCTVSLQRFSFYLQAVLLDSGLETAFSFVLNTCNVLLKGHALWGLCPQHTPSDRILTACNQSNHFRSCWVGTLLVHVHSSWA